MSDDRTIEVSLEVMDKLSGGLAAPQSALQQFFSQTTSGVQGVQSAAEKMALGFIGSMAAAAGGVFTVQKAVELLKESVVKFADAQSSIVTMQRVVENLGVSFTKVGPAIQAAVDQIANFTKFGREDARQAIENLVVVTQDYGKAMNALAAVQDLATFKHESMAQAALSFGLAVEGNTRILRQLGIVLDADTQALFKASSESERFAYLTTIVENRLHGLTQVDAATWAGKWAVASHQVTEAFKEVGGEVLDLWNKFMNSTAPERIWSFLHGDLGGMVLGPPGVTPGGAGMGTLTGGVGMGDIRMAERSLGFRQVPLPPLSGKGTDPWADWTSDMEKLTNQAAELIRNLQITTKSMGSMDAAVVAYQTSIQALSSAQDRVGVEFTDLAPFLARLNQIAGFGFSAPMDAQVQTFFRATMVGSDVRAQVAAAGPDIDAVFQKIRDLSVAAGIDEARAFADQMASQAAQISTDFAKNFQAPLASIFADLADTGGRNLAHIFGQFMKEEFKGIIDSLAEGLRKLFGGGGQVTRDPVTGQFMINGQPATPEQVQVTNQQNQGLNQLMSAILGGIGGAVNMGQQFGTPGVSPIQTGLTGAAFGGAAATAGVGIGALISGGAGAVSGAIAGSVWPIVGTIIGAVVGAVAGLLAPSKSAGFQYGIPSIGPTGDVAFTGVKNIDAGQLAAMVAAVKATYDTTFDSLNKLLQTMGQQMLGPFALRPVVGRFEAPTNADFGLAASAGFQKEFADWVNGNLPREVAQKFFEPLATAFEQFGFSSDRFKQIWASLQTMDPKKIADTLTALGIGAMEISKAISFLSTPTGFGVGGGGLDFWSSIRGQAAASTQQTFASAMGDAMKNLIDLANQAKAALDPATQAADWKAVGDAMAQVQQQELDFVKSLNTAISASTTSWNQMIQGFHLTGMVDASGKPDYARQVAFLKQQADLTFQAIGTAPDIASAQALQARLQQLIQQIVSIGGNEGPGATQGFLAWGETVSAQARDAIVKRLQALGAELDNVNKAFLARFEPLWQSFAAQLTGSASHVSNLGSAADGATHAIAAMADAADAAAAALSGVAGGGGGGGGGTSDASFVADSRARIVSAA